MSPWILCGRASMSAPVSDVTCFSSTPFTLGYSSELAPEFTSKWACPMVSNLLLLKADFEAFGMIIHQAIKLVENCAEQMNARYKKVVFDEWAIISLNENKGRLIAYIGPRKSGFQKNFLTDAGPLRAGLLAGKSNVGDFEFARHGVGTGFESFMVLGDSIFLICNNTV